MARIEPPEVDDGNGKTARACAAVLGYSLEIPRSSKLERLSDETRQTLFDHNRLDREYIQNQITDTGPIVS